MDRNEAAVTGLGGALLIGDGWAIFAGRAADHTAHAHAAIQVALAPRGDVCVRDNDGVLHRAPALVIRALVPHVLCTSTPVVLLYVEKQSRHAAVLADCLGAADIAALDPAAVQFDPDQALHDWAVRLEAMTGGRPSPVDARLLVALRRLEQAPDCHIAEAARGAGLSASRLRALARAELGLPLATWRIWRKLARAIRALGAGASLADAALAGGFADQAHLARAMRRMFGITPRAARERTPDKSLFASFSSEKEDSIS